MAESKKIIVSVEIKESGGDKLSKSSKKATKDLSKLTDAQIAQRVESEKLKLTNAAVTNSIKQRAIAELQATQATKGAKATSGLNNAILLETSRLASDASYGFQGMANNLGQLVSLLQISAQNAGGFKNALKEVLGNLVGTGGILIAIQLLISFLPKLEKAFKKSGEELSEFDKKVRDATKSLDDQLISLERLSKMYNDYFDASAKAKISTKLLSFEFSEFRTGLEKLEKSGNLTEASQQRLVKQFMTLIRSRRRLKELRLEIEQLNKSIADGGDVGGRLSQRLKKRESDETLLILKLIELQKLFEKEQGKSRKRREAAFRKGLFDQSKLEERYRQESIDKSILTEEEKIELQRDFAKEELDIALDLFIEKERLRLETFKKRNVGNQKAILDAEKKFNLSVNEAYQEADDVRRQIDNAYDLDHKDLLVKRASFYEKHYDKVTEIQRKQLQKREEQEADFTAKVNKVTGIGEVARAASQIDSIRGQMDLEQIRFDNKIENLEREAEIARANGLMTIDIEQKIQNERERFANQNIELKVKERDALINITNQLGQAIMANLVEGSNAQKAVSVALATINTYEAATAALGMKPYTPANIAQSAAVVLAGLAQVRNIISTKLPNERGGNMQVEAPDFNVVGASPESQLAQSVSLQQNKPLRSFVVLKDIEDATDTHDMIFENNGLS